MKLFGIGGVRRTGRGGLIAETATFLCAQPVGYTTAAEQNTDEILAALMQIDGRVRGAVQRHRGRLLNAFNFSFTASFPTAPGAFKAAREIVAPAPPIAELPMTQPPIPMICGVHAGQSYSWEGHVFGSSVATAQWVCAQGHGQKIVLSDTAAPLIEPHLPEGLTLRKLALRAKGSWRPRFLFFVTTKEEVARERRAAFVSYRRGGGSEIARLVASELGKRGVETFLDLENMQAAHFDDQLYERIETMPNFVLILTPGCLDRCKDDGDWLRREIAHALEFQRTVIPVLTDGFAFPAGSELPDDVRDLPRHNGVRYTHDFAFAAIDKIASFLQPG